MIRHLLGLCLTLSYCAAAVHTVAPGGSIQDKIDLSQPGDIIVVLGGTYTDDITVSKSIRLIEADGENVRLSGNLTFSGIDLPPSFEGFEFGSPGKGIEIVNTNGLIVKNCVWVAGNGIRIVGNSKVVISGGQSGPIEQNGGEITVLSATVKAFNALNGSLKTVCLQSELDSIDWNAKKSYVAYSRMKSARAGGTGNYFAAIGCVVEFPDGFHGTALELQGAENDFMVVNCELRKLRWGNSGAGERFGRGIAVHPGNKALIANNYIDQQSVDGAWDFLGGDGIVVFDPRSVVSNNILIGSNWAVNAPFGATVANNLVWGFVRGTNRPTAVGGSVFGVTPTDWVVADPLFIPGQAPRFQATSPCIDAGLANPLINDLNGTRNDIGPGGGCLYDPDGWTTDKPVVISFDLAPDFLIKGVDTQVTLSNGQAVGQK